MASTLSAPPLQTPLVEEAKAEDGSKIYLIVRQWNTWLQSLASRGDTAAQVLKVVSLTSQSASIGATPIPLATSTAGRYRVSWYARITTPDAVSSSLTVTIGWAESSVALTLAGPAITGNITTSVQSGMVMILSDQASPITYATTYASNTPAAMVYRLDVVAELVQ